MLASISIITLNMAVFNKEQVCWVDNWKLIMWLFRKDILTINRFPNKVNYNWLPSRKILYIIKIVQTILCLCIKWSFVCKCGFSLCGCLTRHCKVVEDQLLHGWKSVIQLLSPRCSMIIKKVPTLISKLVTIPLKKKC